MSCIPLNSSMILAKCYVIIIKPPEDPDE